MQKYGNIRTYVCIHYDIFVTYYFCNFFWDLLSYKSIKIYYIIPIHYPNDVRLTILGNKEILGKSQIRVET